ncbi:DNA polymerase III subunit beta [Sporohalobacter salinus]|uniref:DNA polymerase III subunit beta n=1 Tax=Sporohalobacter salinus TaxID=1494606 RepID=UPI00195F6A4A|nr:DNA polymerase III subunit beta [Sporohalobacter salinus]MBM7624300.1 DNA polymerase-3 subunit beta [Sporohalobacter salinus]
MQIKIDKNDFYDGIQTVRKAISSKSTLPILSGILIKTQEEELKLVGTDLELGIECKVNANIIKDGSIVLPANYLANIIRELPNKELNLELKEDNKVEISCGSSEFKIHGSPADEYPLLPEVNSDTEYNLSQETFQKMIDRIKFATSDDESRPFLTGGLLSIDNKNLKLVATDSYRLAYTQLELENDLEKQEIIIPSKTLDELSKLLTSEDDIRLLIADNQILFEFSGIVIISRLIEGQFPNYKQVIPNNHETEVKLERKKLLNSAKRAALVARNNSNIIKTKFHDNKLIIESNAPEVGQAYEELSTSQQGDNTEIAFNANYLIDVLKVIDEEEILIELSGELSPGVIKEVDNDNYIHVIMPVRST